MLVQQSVKISMVVENSSAQILFEDRHNNTEMLIVKHIVVSVHVLIESSENEGHNML